MYLHQKVTKMISLLNNIVQTVIFSFLPSQDELDKIVAEGFIKEEEDFQRWMNR